MNLKRETGKNQKIEFICSLVYVRSRCPFPGLQQFGIIDFKFFPRNIWILSYSNVAPCWDMFFLLYKKCEYQYIILFLVDVLWGTGFKIGLLISNLSKEILNVRKYRGYVRVGGIKVYNRLLWQIYPSNYRRSAVLNFKIIFRNITDFQKLFSSVCNDFKTRSARDMDTG